MPYISKDLSIDSPSIVSWAIADLAPAPVNDTIYKPIDPADPEVQKLAVSIQQEGVQEPLLITLDCVILSGHRRFTAAKLVGLTHVPVIIRPIYSTSPDFIKLLVECNHQRVKSRDERLRETLATINPQEARKSLLAYRKEQAAIGPEVSTTFTAVIGNRTRSAISKALYPFLNAIIRVINERIDYWPLSDRQIHYALLNHPPLTHASKPGSAYTNTPSDYKKLTNLLTRARIEEKIPMHIIADETRPFDDWNMDTDTCAYMDRALHSFLRGYTRNLQQTQPNHIEIIAEKNTVAGILRPIARKYCIPLTIARGYCSLPPRDAIVKRFKNSGKENLILLFASDFDPDGEEIYNFFGERLCSDFRIDKRRIKPRKVALTIEQVQRFGLQSSMEPKASSSNYAKFAKKYPNSPAYELEAIPPQVLQQALDEAISEIIDWTAMNKEIEEEAADAQILEARRRIVFGVLGLNNEVE